MKAADRLPDFVKPMQAKLVGSMPVGLVAHREGSTVRNVLFSAVS
jgi:hypothetical protein